MKPKVYGSLSRPHRPTSGTKNSQDLAEILASQEEAELGRQMRKQNPKGDKNGTYHSGS